MKKILGNNYSHLDKPCQFISLSVLYAGYTKYFLTLIAGLRPGLLFQNTPYSIGGWFKGTFNCPHPKNMVLSRLNFLSSTSIILIFFKALHTILTRCASNISRGPFYENFEFCFLIQPIFLAVNLIFLLLPESENSGILNKED